jgi:hypothetical protein
MQEVLNVYDDNIYNHYILSPGKHTKNVYDDV